MNLRRIWMTIALLSAAAVVPQVAYGQATALTGTWTLAEVNGNALPATTETNTSCQEVVVSGTLHLLADGEWEFEYLERETCGTNVEEDREEEGGDYTASGQRLVFSDDTTELKPDDLELDELGVGTVTGDNLSVTLQDGQTVMVFRRSS